MNFFSSVSLVMLASLVSIFQQLFWTTESCLAVWVLCDR